MDIQQVITRQAELLLAKSERSSDGFIVSNTKHIELDDLAEGCIIPVFSKDNESTISHQEFIQATMETVSHVFSRERILKPAVRVSHPVKGRLPEAMGKPAELLLPEEKTVYYERMAFTIEIPSIQDTVNGNTLSLTVGGVRAYNHQNLYSRKSEEHFKVFIGFKNWVCINLCISTDGLRADIPVRSTHELVERILHLITEYDVPGQLKWLNELSGYEISESQFAHLVGKTRMYPHLPAEIRKGIPNLQLGDAQVNTVVRDYYRNKSFCRSKSGDIDLWRLYNLFTGANKSSYIDTFLDRGAAVHNFTGMLKNSLKDLSHNWYIS